MYCSTCGIAVAESLSYCNHCGARIIAPNSESLDTSREVKPGLLVAAMAGTFILGLIAITALLGVLKSVLDLASGQILGFAVLCFSMLIFLESVYLVLLFRQTRGAQKRATTEALAGHTTKELSAPQVQALREPLASVTEQTTRTFEPIYTDRNKS